MWGLAKLNLRGAPTKQIHSLFTGQPAAKHIFFFLTETSLSDTQCHKSRETLDLAAVSFLASLD